MLPAHNGVDFFIISTAKSAPSMVCLVRFLFRNVLTATTACTFSRSQLPKCSGNGVLCTFLLRNVLRATTACTFSRSQLPKCSGNGVLCTFLLRNVLRATTATTFRHLNFQNAPMLLCFVHFDFHACFASRRRAIFHLASSRSSHMAPHPPL